MSFPRYPKYKDSGVEWLGEVPEHWGVSRARELGVFSASGIDKKDVDTEVEVAMFNYLDVYKSTTKALAYSPELMTTTAPAEKVLEHSVREGDILLTPSSETPDDIGHAARVLAVPHGVVYSYHLLRLRPGAGVDAAYLTYCLNSGVNRAYFSSVCTGTTRMVLVREDFKNATFAMPPLKEQVAIVSVLDRETAKIDALVAEQQRLMELLKEERQAVISHAVTKGLNPDAPMRPSGVEWLGEVPAHWEVVPLASIARVLAGYAFDSSLFGDTGTPVIRMSDFRDGVIFKEGAQCVPSEQVPEAALAQAGDVLLGLSGSISNFAIVGPDDIPAAVNQRVAIVRSYVPTLPLIAWFLQSIEFTHQLAADLPETTIQNVSMSQLRHVRVPFPPPDEQVAIARHLAQSEQTQDDLVTAVRDAISLLHSRRAALISAAVTGQIDVRHLATAEAA